jgi:hypothetical protein
MTALYNPNEGLEQICEGLRQVAFDPIAGLNGFDFPHGSPPLPAGIVVPPDIDYRLAMAKGVVGLNFELWVMVGSSAGHQQQKSLWRYLNWAGPQSIVALVDANRSLGIVGSDGAPRVEAHVARARRLTLDEMPPFESMAFGVAFETPVVVTNKE